MAWEVVRYDAPSHTRTRVDLFANENEARELARSLNKPETHWVYHYAQEALVWRVSVNNPSGSVSEFGPMTARRAYRICERERAIGSLATMERVA